MSLRLVAQIAAPVIVLFVLSCTNAVSTGDGFGGGDTVGVSGDAGGAGDGAGISSGSQPGSPGARSGLGSTTDAAPAATGSTEGGGAPPTSHDSGAGRSDTGASQTDAGSPPDATTMDASTADATTTYDAAVCTTQNLGCMLAPPPSTGDIRQDCVNRINQFRTQCACLPPLQRWTAGEACADQQATYDSQMMSAHGGFIATQSACGQAGSMWAQCCSMGGVFPGPLANAQDECPGYPDTSTVIDQCLQQMWNEGPPPGTVQACEMDTSGCFQMHGHFINMTSTMSTKVACGFSSMTGPALWAAQNFAP